jgi:hypothetical protein
MKLFYNNEPFPEEEREISHYGKKWANAAVRMFREMQRQQEAILGTNGPMTGYFGGEWGTAAPAIRIPRDMYYVDAVNVAPLPPQEAPEPELAQTQIYWNRGDGGVVQWGEVPAVRTELRNINFDGVMLPPVDTADLDW